MVLGKDPAYRPEGSGGARGSLHLGRSTATGWQICWPDAPGQSLPTACLRSRTQGLLAQRLGRSACKERLAQLDPYLAQVHDTFIQPPEPCTAVVGTITQEWAQRLHLPAQTLICGVSFDAHGRGRRRRVCGHDGRKHRHVRRQHDGRARGRCAARALRSWPVRQKTAFSPGYVGIETSQSAFGDTYAWLKRLLLWPFEALLAGSGLPQEQQNALTQQAGQQLLPLLEQAAKALPPQPELVALDWFNGRRYPYNNDQASSAVCGLDLGVSAPALYRALVEATAYGQRRIVTGLTEHGIRDRPDRRRRRIGEKMPLSWQSGRGRAAAAGGPAGGALRAGAGGGPRRGGGRGCPRPRGKKRGWHPPPRPL